MKKRVRRKCRNCGKRMPGPSEYRYRVCCKKCSDEYERFTTCTDEDRYDLGSYFDNFVDGRGF